MEYNKEKYENFLNEFNPKVIIGKGVDWKYIEIELKKIVHLLFGWQSGSGKSVFVLQFLFQLLFLSNPDTLKLLLVDPLRVSFKDFKELPNLLAPVWNTAMEAIAITNQMMEINRERYIFLENIWFEDIYEYNEALLENKIPYKIKWLKKLIWLQEIPEEYIKKTSTENYKLWEPIPQVVVFYDEFNALMLDPDFGWKTPENASTPVLKDLIGVSEQARKAWIIIILGTQKISAATVPTAIRWNLKTRICLKVSSWAASRTILWDTAENNNQWAKLVGYWDLLVYNEDLNSKIAIRWQSFYVSFNDMLDLLNGIVTTYWKNKFEYIKVNEDYAQNEEDLEPSPIPYEDFKVGLPNLIIVKNNVFLKDKYTKLLTEIIKNPFFWDDKVLALRFGSIKKDLKSIKQKLIDSRILAMNKVDWSDKEYLGLNLKLKGINYIYDKYGIDPNNRESWDTDNYDYQIDMMKLCLIHLNKTYNAAARKLSYDLKEYE